MTKELKKRAAWGSNISQQQKDFQAYVGQMFKALRLEAGLDLTEASRLCGERPNYYEQRMEAGAAGFWRTATYMRHFEEDPRIVLPKAYLSEKDWATIAPRHENLLKVLSREVKAREHMTKYMRGEIDG